MPIRPVLGCVGVVIWAQNRPQGFWRSIVKILGLLADSILTMVREPTFYTPLARPLITCTPEKSVSSIYTQLGGSGERHRQGGKQQSRREASAKGMIAWSQFGFMGIPQVR